MSTGGGITAIYGAHREDRFAPSSSQDVLFRLFLPDTNLHDFFFFLCLPQVSLFDLTRLMLLEACEGGSRYKESTFCKLVTEDLSVFLSGVKNYAKGAVGD